MTDPVLPGSPRLVVKAMRSSELARATADHVATEAARALADRGRFVIAVSGGSTPGPMLSNLFARELPWDRVTILQVDERFAPEGDPDRNLTDLRRRLKNTPASTAKLRPMPVGMEPAAAVARYARQLNESAGEPSMIDLVQLGLGADGHTASLIPGDAALEVTDADVAETGTYQGRRRMTLTFPAINRARARVWMVAGEEKCAAIRGLVTGDATLPATYVRRDGVVFADAACLG